MKKRNIIMLSLIGVLCLISYFHYMIQKYSILETASEFKKYEENKLAEMEQEPDSQDNQTLNTSSNLNQSENQKNDTHIPIVDSKNSGVNEIITKGNKQLESNILNNMPLKKTNYFIEARLNTNIEREKTISLLSEIIDNERTNEETRKAAGEEKMKLIDIMGKEKVIENLIKAKGFNDALVLITDRSVSIIIESEKISDSEMAKILDIVVRETQAPLNDIKIWNRF